MKTEQKLNEAVDKEYKLKDLASYDRYVRRLRSQAVGGCFHQIGRRLQKLIHHSH